MNLYGEPQALRTLLTHHIALSPAGFSVPFELRRWLHVCRRIFIWLRSVQSVFQSIPEGAVLFPLIIVFCAKTFVTGSNANATIEIRITVPIRDLNMNLF